MLLARIAAGEDNRWFEDGTEITKSGGINSANELDALRLRARQTMSQPHDYYDVLGVLPSAELIVIRAAFRALAKKYHPDSWDGSKHEAELRMRSLNEAYEILSNGEKRRAYDRERKQNQDESF